MEDFPETPALEAAEEGVDDRLHRALRSLPKDNRQAVELLKFKGMSLEAAAKKLGISTAALKVRAHRGYGLLRKFLTTQQDEKE
jgi:RNA polymerase sigma-70 factor (ECF subfamily)